MFYAVLNTYFTINQKFFLPTQPSVLQRRIQNPTKHLKMELFAKIVDSSRPLTIVAKSSIVDVRKGSEYASVLLLKLLCSKASFDEAAVHWKCFEKSKLEINSKW